MGIAFDESIICFGGGEQWVLSTDDHSVRQLSDFSLSHNSLIRSYNGQVYAVDNLSLHVMQADYSWKTVIESTPFI